MSIADLTREIEFPMRAIVLSVTAGSKVIAVEQVSKTFWNSGSRLAVLSGVDFEVIERQIVCIVGPSGCGKTTLLRIITGLEQADSGFVSLQTPDNRQLPRERVVSFLFQQPVLLRWRTAKENVRLPLEVLGEVSGPRRGLWEERCEALLRLAGLEGFEDWFPSQLSGGMQARVALARALITEAPILLMDEPFSALDDITRTTLQSELIGMLASVPRTVLFVTHSLEEAILLGDRILVMSARPARIVADFRVDLPRDRRFAERDSPALAAHRAELRGLLARHA